MLFSVSFFPPEYPDKNSQLLSHIPHPTVSLLTGDSDAGLVLVAAVAVRSEADAMARAPMSRHVQYKLSIARRHGNFQTPRACIWTAAFAQT